jgi:hypothetical protein
MRWWLLVLCVSAVACKKPVQFGAQNDTDATASSAALLEGGAPVASAAASSDAPSSSAPKLSAEGFPTGLPLACKVLDDTPPAGMIQILSNSDGRTHLSGVQGETDCKPIDPTHMACDAWTPPAGVRGKSKPWTMAQHYDAASGGRFFYGHSVLGGPLYCYERQPLLTSQSANVGGPDCPTCTPGAGTKKDTGPKKPRR